MKQFGIAQLKIKSKHVKPPNAPGFPLPPFFHPPWFSPTDRAGWGRRLSHAVKEADLMREKYQKECLQRKLLYNKIQELRGTVAPRRSGLPGTWPGAHQGVGALQATFASSAVAATMIACPA